MDVNLNSCIWCQRSLHGKSARTIQEGAERDLVAENIAPRQIPDGALICEPCWVYTKRILQERGVLYIPCDNLNKCVCCERSLFNRRRQLIPDEGPVRNEIIARIHPKEIPKGGFICFACLISARRAVQRAAIGDPPVLPAPALRPDLACVCCKASLYRRHTHLLRSGPVRDRIAARIYPSEVPEHHAHVCNSCWNKAQEDVAIEQGEILAENVQPTVPESTISLDDFWHTPNSSSSCFVPNCENRERNTVPRYCRKRILKSKHIFVTDNARVCNVHRAMYDWEFLDEHQFSNSFMKKEIESMLKLLIEEEDSDILPQDSEPFVYIDVNGGRDSENIDVNGRQDCLKVDRTV